MSKPKGAGQWPEWISVKERLPRKGQRVLCTFAPTTDGKLQLIVIDSLDRQENSWARGTLITHWLPLPLPPKKGKP
jgi:hypothetical protein